MRNLYFLVLLFLFSCGTSPEKEMRTGLYAKLSTAKKDLHSLNDAEFNACIKNYGPGDTTVNEYILQNAILATEVKDDSGNMVLSVPPSVPPIGLNEYNLVLHPGDSVMYNYKLNIFVIPDRKGKYHVSLKGIDSEELVFKVN